MASVDKIERLTWAIVMFSAYTLAGILYPVFRDVACGTSNSCSAGTILLAFGLAMALDCVITVLILWLAGLIRLPSSHT